MSLLKYNSSLNETSVQLYLLWYISGQKRVGRESTLCTIVLVVVQVLNKNGWKHVTLCTILLVVVQMDIVTCFPKGK